MPDDNKLEHTEYLIKNYQFHKAIALLEQALQHSEINKIKIWHKLAECHTQLGNLSKAKIYFKNILARDSGHVQALNQLGKIYLKEDDTPRAQRCYQQLLNLDSTNSYYYKNLARIKAKQGIMSRAIQLYDSALIFNPDDLESIIALAEIYSDLMEVEKTLEQSYHEILDRGFRIDSLNKRLLEFKAENDYQ